MLISDKYKVIFVHIPKTGGTFVYDILNKLDNDLKIVFDERFSRYELTHHSIPNKEESKKYIDDGYYMFCFIRNPYDLIRSFYSFVSNNPNHKAYKQVKSLSFLEFIKRDKILEDDLPNYITKSYVHQGLYVNQNVDTLLFDNLEEELIRIFKERGVENIEDVISSSKNRNKSDSNKIVHNDETRKILSENKLFMKDLELYNKLKEEK